MNNSKFTRLARVSMVVALAGAVAVFAGFFSYITRYATLDSLDGSIDEGLYEQITQMFATEKVILFGGIILAIVGVTGIVLALVAKSKAARAGR